jgi:hypothetical protein
VVCLKTQNRIQNVFESCFGKLKKKEKRGIFFFSPLSLSLGLLGIVLYPQASSTMSHFWASLV